MKSDGEETDAQFAYRIGASTASVLSDIFRLKPDDLNTTLDLAVRIAVLRAFGCTCTPGRAMGIVQGNGDTMATYFEDITCEVHGVGPLMDSPDRKRRDDPGA